ncbi:MAG TPA: sialidase family protein [Verrucomicrobium sp.]|nr:sialidase family protein [Verrucomicrobium sp.]
MLAPRFVLLAAVLVFVALPPCASAVEIMAVPKDGIQPRAVVDGKGVLHLVWYTGSPKGGNLHHATCLENETWSPAVRVNSLPDSAVAAGTIRGAQVAMGREGHIHVVWNGFDATAPKGTPMPLYYTRSLDGGRTFTPQQVVSGDWPMDGGGAVAADVSGKVHVFWHAGQHGGGEDMRRIFIRTSEDDGMTFGSERAISPEGTGVCACCSMQAIATRAGNVHVLYRTANDSGKSRNIATLVSGDGGKTFSHAEIDPWRINGCPMSSMSLVEVQGGAVVGAWEREGQIVLGHFAPASNKPGKFTTAMGDPSQRKHPVLAAGRDGTLLIAWAEGTGWNKGGTLAWQIVDQDLTLNSGSKLVTAGRVPVWSFSSVAAVGGSFVLVR